MRVEEHLIYTTFPQLQATDNKIQDLIDVCHQAAVLKGWWGPDGLQDKPFTEFIALTHSEISEGIEYHEKTINDERVAYDDHLPEFDGRLVEVADAMIRVFDWAGRYGYNLVQTIFDRLGADLVNSEVTSGALVSSLLDHFVDGPDISYNNKLLWLFSFMNVRLSKCLELNRKAEHVGNAEIEAELAHMTSTVFVLTKILFHADLERVILKKVNYNLHRPDKHNKNY